MNKVMIGALAGTAGLAAAIGTGVLGRNFASGVADRNGVQRMDHAYTDQAEQRAALKPGESISPFADIYNPGEYNGTGSVMMVPLGIGLAGLGVFALTQRMNLAGAVAIAVGGAVAGLGIGGVQGRSRGEIASEHAHGMNIADQAVEVVQTYDVDGDSILSLEDQGRIRGEFYRQNIDWVGIAHPATDVSISKFVHAADGNGDEQVDAAEVKALLDRYDTNGNGELSRPETEAFTADGLELEALRYVK